MRIIKPQAINSTDSIQLLNPKREKRLTQHESRLIELETKKRFDQVTIADRLCVNGSIYWTRNYASRTSSDSFTICFLFNQREYYGQILEFFQIDKSFFCFVSKFNVLDSSAILPKINSYFCEVSCNILFDRFFKLIEISDEILLVNCNNILHRCIFVNNGNLNFITKVAY